MQIKRGAAVPLLLALGLAGCGSGGAEPSVASLNHGAPASTSVSPSATRSPLAFTRCLREHGLDVPDPSADHPDQFTIDAGNGTDKATVDAAMAACKDLDPGGGTPPKLSADELEAQKKMSQCMRDNGVPKFPDPDANGRIQIQGSPDLDPMSAVFKAAEQKCAALLPKDAKRGDGPSTQDSSGGSSGQT